MIDLDKEREAFEIALDQFDLTKAGGAYVSEEAQCAWAGWVRCAEAKQAQLQAIHDSRIEWLEYARKIESGDYVLVPREPTEEMLISARDWSIKKYGQGVGNDGALGCYKAMIEASQERE